MDEEFLDDYEKELVEGYETHDIKRDAKSIEEMAKIVAAAEESMKRDQRISIRISAHDLMALKYKAAQEGLPYSALISSILHKYATNADYPSA